MFREMYVIQDSVSRQFGEPFVSSNDDAVRRSIYPVFAHEAQQHPEVLDGVVLAIAAVSVSEDSYRIEPYVTPRRVCGGHDSEVTALIRQFARPEEPAPDEDEIFVNAAEVVADA